MPCCSPCKRIGKPCPGSGSGLIFFHTQAAGSEVAPHRATVSPPASTPSTVSSYRSSCSPPSPKNEMLFVALATTVGSHHQSPWLRFPWFFVLPGLHLHDDVRRSFVVPLKATTEAFRALHSSDNELSTSAFSQYVTATRQQRLQVAQILRRGGPVDQEAVLHRIIMALLLLEFASTAPVTLPSQLVEQSAVAVHARGAVDLLQLVGPVRCQNSPFFEIFWHLRLTMV